MACELLWKGKVGELRLNSNCRQVAFILRLSEIGTFLLSEWVAGRCRGGYVLAEHRHTGVTLALPQVTHARAPGTRISHSTYAQRRVRQPHRSRFSNRSPHFSKNIPSRFWPPNLVVYKCTKRRSLTTYQQPACWPSAIDCDGNATAAHLPVTPSQQFRRDHQKFSWWSRWPRWTRRFTCGSRSRACAGARSLGCAIPARRRRPRRGRLLVAGAKPVREPVLPRWRATFPEAAT